MTSDASRSPHPGPRRSKASHVPRSSSHPAARLLACLLIATSLAGCGAMRSYRAEMDETLRHAAEGDLPGALKVLDKNNKRDSKDLLYFLERGELKRLENDYTGSFEALRAADTEILAWEAAAKLDPTRNVGKAASFLVNDRLRTYEGFDYEKVFVTTRLAMNHLALGDFDQARIEIKRTHEREAFIAEIRAQEYQKVRDEALAKGAKVSFREINGYPVQGIETPEAAALRNGYQNALSHYLAGFVYEALGEQSLAAPGYRTAIELRPGESVLDDTLAGLDARIDAPDDGGCETVFVIETGAIPGRISQSFSLPIPVLAYGAITYIQASFPVLPPPAMGYQPPDVLIDGSTSVPTAHILDLDAMARRALADEMPGIMLRTFTRSATKAIAQFELQRQMLQQQRRGQDSLGAALALIVLQIGGAIVEQADERGWRTLPAQVAIARAHLPRGRHTVAIRTDNGLAQFEVNLAGRHALVGVRLFRGRSFVAVPPGARPAEAAPSEASDPSGEALYARVETIDIPFESSTSRRNQK
jgi:hypothetical protein